MASSRLLVTVSLAFAIVLGAFLTLTSGSWVWLPLVLAIHAGGTAAVVVVTMRLLGQVEAPDPRVTARLEAEGMRDPERELNDRIESDGGREPGKRVKRLLGEDAGELASPGDDAAAAARDQQVAWTPASASTRAAGPRSPLRRR